MLCIVLASGSLLAPAAGEPPDWWRGLFEDSLSWADQFMLPGYELDRGQLPDPEESWALLEGFSRALRTASPGDLARYRTQLETLLAWMDTVPEARPLRDWLRPRLDYCRQAARLAEDPAPPPTRTAPEQPRTPAPRPSPAPAPAPARDTVQGQTADWMARLADRSPPRDARRLAGRLRPVFEKEGVPGELVWLAEVESSFNPRAVSPVGAAGLYQFMPATAREMGLSLAPDDERYDPGKSARAAARYLKRLHRRFESWPLALASYNAGQGRVNGLLRRHGTTAYNDIAAHLPAETRMYVPKVLATIRLREDVDLARM